MWDKMETFYHVVKAGSFTKAEQLMNKSQPALSRSVSILEERLGHKLLRRKIKGLELTRKGKEVFQTAQHMIMDIKLLKTTLSEDSGVQGKIRISTTYAISDFILSDYLIEFNKKHPNITFEIVSSDSDIDLASTEVDVAIRPYDKLSPNISQEYLVTFQQKLYASKEYLKKYGVPETVEDLDKHRILARARPLEHPYSNVEWALRIGCIEHRKRKPVFEANSSESLINAAKKNLGIVTSFKEMKNIKNSDLVEVLPNTEGPKYDFYFITLSKLEKSDKIQALKEFLVDEFKGS